MLVPSKLALCLSPLPPTMASCIWGPQEKEGPAPMVHQPQPIALPLSPPPAIQFLSFLSFPLIKCKSKCFWALFVLGLSRYFGEKVRVREYSTDDSRIEDGLTCVCASTMASSSPVLPLCSYLQTRLLLSAYAWELVRHQRDRGLRDSGTANPQVELVWPPTDAPTP